MPEIPARDDFSLTGDADENVYMQCRRCRETWQVVTLADAMDAWYAHRCGARSS